VKIGVVMAHRRIDYGHGTVLYKQKHVSNGNSQLRPGQTDAASCGIERDVEDLPPAPNEARAEHVSNLVLYDHVGVTPAISDQPDTHYRRDMTAVEKLQSDVAGDSLSTTIGTQVRSREPTDTLAQLDTES